MERASFLLISTVLLFVAPAVRGTAHLQFSNATVSITRDGCGVTKLCVETPSDCDPAGNSNCLFTSLITSTPSAPDGANLTMQLSGNSNGYIAVGLTANVSEGITFLFVCANFSGTFAFRTITLNNTDNTQMGNERNVTEIRGNLTGTDLIQCEFNILNLNATSTRTSDAVTFQVLLGSGNVTGGNGIGPFMANLTSSPLNVSNANATDTANTTTAPMTTSSGTSGSDTPHAVLLLLGILMLSVLKTA